MLTRKSSLDCRVQLVEKIRNILECQPCAVGEDHSRVVIFDGSCGFCVWSLQLVAQKIRPRNVVYMPFQWLASCVLMEFGTNAEQCARAIHVWDVKEKRIYHGADAFSQLVIETKIGQRIEACPGLSRILLGIARPVYVWIALNRTMLSALLRTQRHAIFGTNDD